HDRTRKVPEVTTMPRSLQEVLAHADQLEREFANHAPNDVHDGSALRALREAATQRAVSERHVPAAVITARNEGISWPAIGAMLGTSGEAARKRYGQNRSKSA